MSAPIKHENNPDDPRLYAPPWARQRAQAAPADPQLATSPPMAPGVGGPNVDWPLSATAPAKPGRERLGGTEVDWAASGQRLPAFEGDVAIRDLRQRMSLDPESVPEPPMRKRRGAVVPWLARLSVVLAVAAVAAFGVTQVRIPYDDKPYDANDANPTPVKRDKEAAAVAPALAGVLSRPQAAQLARLVVEGRQAFANDPLPLGVALRGASGNEILLLSGLASGTRLSAGGPAGANGWRFSAGELGNVLAYAPKDFVGVMDAAVDVRGANDAVVDSQVVRLEWLPKQVPKQVDAPAPKPAPTPLQRLEAEEIAMLMKRGQEFLKTGDIAAARLVLRRAASAGNAQAALALGATYDPIALMELGVLGFAPDPAQARAWYQRATELGSPDASRRLERLARAVR